MMGKMLEAIFQEYNSAHFGGILPPPKLRWNTRLSSTAGRFCPGRRLLFTPAEIEVATYLRDLPDGEIHIRDTVLHEMIHYYLWHQKKPYGHTAEFHSIMKRVGAKRYNPVPKQRAYKYSYECSHCKMKLPTRRKLNLSACASCCDKFNGGNYDARFRLIPTELVAESPREPKIATAPIPVEEEPRLPVSEIIRRLEDLKAMIRMKKS